MDRRKMFRAKRQEEGALRTRSHNLQDDSPEAAVQRYLLAWRDRRWRDMAAEAAEGEDLELGEETLELIEGRVTGCFLVREDVALVWHAYAIAGRGEVREGLATVQAVRERSRWKVRGTSVQAASLGDFDVWGGGAEWGE